MHVHPKCLRCRRPRPACEASTYHSLCEDCWADTRSRVSTQPRTISQFYRVNAAVAAAMRCLDQRRRTEG
jgi:hypothetical protein